MYKTITFIFTLLCGALLLTLPVYGQKKAPKNPEKWYPGKVVFTSGRTITGKILYEFPGSEKEHETVSVFNGTTVSVYNADTVSDFSYEYDEQRFVFTSLPHRLREQSKMYFFQVLEDGNLTLLKRTYYQYSPETSWGGPAAPSGAGGMIPMSSPPPEPRDISAQYYTTCQSGSYLKVEVLYVIDEDAEAIEECSGKYEMLDLMKSNREEMRKFIRRKIMVLEDDREWAFRKIVRKYNSLAKN